MKFTLTAALVLLSVLYYNAQAQTTFTKNETIVTYNDNPANPFPSELSVSGLDPYTTKVRVTLSNVNIPGIVCIQAYLESPTGQQVCLFSKSGSAFFTTTGNLIFDMDASIRPPATYGGDFTAGTYLPSIENTQDLPPGISDNLDLFNGHNPNGTWKLYVNGFIPDAPVAVGEIPSWSLTITSTDNPLPLTLTKFYAKKQTDRAVLSWETAQERNTGFFEIQRSADGKQFAPIGEVKASDTSDEPVRYTFTDQQPLERNNYYRLRMVDLDATATFSETRMLNFGTSKTHIYPNPVTDQLFINHSDAVAAESVRIMHVSGIEVLSQSLTAASDLQTIDVAHLPAGAYYVIIGAESYALIKH